jgi:DNA polymerase III epsilon subunit-like protein
MTDIVVIDTETTSQYPERAKILEVAAVIVRNDLIEDRFYNSLVNPGIEHLVGAEGALAVNGLKKEEIAAAPAEKLVREHFVRFIADAKLPITSFNVHYDKVVLNTNEWATLELEWGECIMLAAQRIMGKAGALPFRKGDYKYPNLNEAGRFFGVGSGTHRAIEDARTAAKVWIAISKMLAAQK